MTHKTRRIVIESAEVDIDAIPVVRWLNALRDVRTLFCCHGDNRKDEPYVLFECASMRTLEELVETLDEFHSHFCREDMAFLTQRTRGRAEKLEGEPVRVRAVHSHDRPMRFIMTMPDRNTIKALGTWLEEEDLIEEPHE